MLLREQILWCYSPEGFNKQLWTVWLLFINAYKISGSRVCVNWAMGAGACWLIGSMEFLCIIDRPFAFSPLFSLLSQKWECSQA